MIVADPLGTLDAGHHHYIFNGSELSSGTYFFCLEAEEQSAAVKVLLVK